MSQHTSTLTPAQRIAILDGLHPFYGAKLMMRFTDPQLYELWLIETGRPNPYRVLDSSVTKMYKEELCIDGLGDTR